MENVNEKGEVVQIDGQVPAANDQQKTEEVVIPKTDGFDPKAFLDGSAVSNPPTSDSTESDDNKGVSKDDIESDFVWPEEDIVIPNEDKNVPKADDNKTNAPSSDKTDDKKTDTVVGYETFIKELGIEAKDINELKDVLNSLVEENKKLKSSPEQIVNKKIEEYQKFLNLDDETLVRKSFEADGLKGEKIDKAIEKMVDTGLIEIEATKIRNTLDKAIQSESESIKQSKQSEIAKQQKEREDAVREIHDFMSKKDSLLGFKLTSKPDQLPVIQKQHAEYVTSGNYLADITQSAETMAESAWLWKNREVLKKALQNRGVQQARKEIFENLGHAELGSATRLTAPDNNSEFDPKKFIQGA